MKVFNFFFVFLFIGLINPAFSFSPDLVAYWTFDDSSDSTPNDVVNGNNGAFVANANYQGGSNIAPVQGNVDSLELHGFGDYLTVPDSPTLDLPGSFTISAWVSLHTNNSENNIISKDEPSFFSNYNFHIFNNRLFLSTKFDAGASVSSGSGACDGGGCYVLGASPFVDGAHPLGTWRHIAGVYNDAAKTMTVYLDGMKDGQVTFSTTGKPSTNNAALQIGQRKAIGTASSTDGWIDEVKLYHGALTSQEIYQDYTGLVAYWTFNNSSDPTPDDVVNGNNGTFVANASYQGGSNIAPVLGNVDSLELHGFGDYLTVPDNTTLDLSGSFTISAWVSLHTNNNENNIVSKDELSNFTNYNLHIYTNRVFLSTKFDQVVTASSGNGGCDGGGCLVIGTSAFVDGTHPLGTWRHIAGVYNDATKTMTVYLDGAKDGEVTFVTTGRPMTNNEALQIGQRKAAGTASSTDGWIDEVRIHGNVLSAAEIAALANGSLNPTITGPDEICSGTVITLDAGAGFSSYLWSTGETTRTISVNPSATTTYSVVVSDENEVEATDDHTVNVHSVPVPVITGPSTAVCDGNPTVLDAGAGFTSYLWSTGQTTQAITVVPGATTSYSVTVTNSSGCFGTASFTVPIKTCPSLSINDVSISEGHSGTKNAAFTVGLSYVSTENVSVQFVTTAGTAVAGQDYTHTTGNLQIPAGSNQGVINVSLISDTVFEPNETFTVDLNSPVNATIAKQQGIGMILNDDVTVSIDDASVIEGNGAPKSLSFNVNLSAPYDLNVSLHYQTANGSASAGTDYTNTSGTLTIPAGSSIATISVPVIGDSIYEIDEDISMTLSAPVNVTILDGQATGTIANDDTAPSILINNVTIVEGQTGTTSMNFTVTLSKTSGSPTTFSFVTADDSTTAESDYSASNGTLTIPAGATTATISINAFGDQLYESNETFFVNLYSSANATLADAQGKGVIQNDDNQPSLSINNISITEGHTGMKNAEFTIMLSMPSGMETTVRVQTANDTANFKKDDYVRTNETVTIPAGQLSALVAVPVIGDATVESNETFFVNLAAPSNATIDVGQGVCTISNDD